jgi:hypothetical protein
MGIRTPLYRMLVLEGAQYLRQGTIQLSNSSLLHNSGRSPQQLECSREVYITPQQVAHSREVYIRPQHPRPTGTSSLLHWQSTAGLI